jgi:hypothetical protein
MKSKLSHNSFIALSSQLWFQVKYYLGPMTLSIMTLSITTQSIMGLILILSIKDSWHKDTQHNYTLNKVSVLILGLFSRALLCGVPLFRVSWCCYNECRGATQSANLFTVILSVFSACHGDLYNTYATYLDPML